MKKTDKTKNLSEIYDDILDIKIGGNDSFNSVMEKFYEVMRKHGICQGEWSENGHSIYNAEWNMCYAVFKQHKIIALDLWLLLLHKIPEDLESYDKE